MLAKPYVDPDYKRIQRLVWSSVEKRTHRRVSSVDCRPRATFLKMGDELECDVVFDDGARYISRATVTHVAYSLVSQVIATTVGGIAESVREGDTGLTCPPEDPGALAAALVRFFAEGLGARMAAPIGALRAEHSWEALARSTLDLIDELRPARGWT